MSEHAERRDATERRKVRLPGESTHAYRSEKASEIAIRLAKKIAERRRKKPDDR